MKLLPILETHCERESEHANLENYLPTLHVTVTQTGLMAYLWTAGALSAEIKQFGLAVGDQGSGPGAHA